jgi:hypothetical protein
VLRKPLAAADDRLETFYWIKEFPSTSTISRQDFQETCGSGLGSRRRKK